MAFAAVAGSVLDLAREERAALAELLQDVAAEGGVLLEERDQSEVERPVAAAHQRLEDRQVLARVDEGAPLDQLPLLPEEALELRGVERPEPAPEDEVLRRRDARNRVELEEAEPADGLEDAARPAVEPLRAYGDPARLLERDRHAAVHASPPVPHGYRTSSSPSTRARRTAARSSFAAAFPRVRGSRWKRRTWSTPSPRSALRSARPTMRSPASSGST